MSWYTLVDGVNKPHIPEEWSKSIIKGNAKICHFIYDLIASHISQQDRTFVLALDGFLGSNLKGIVEQITELLNDQNLTVEIVDVNTLFKSQDMIDKYAQSYLTDDPSFGIVCKKGSLKDLMNPPSLIDFRQKRQILTFPLIIDLLHSSGIWGLLTPSTRVYQDISCSPVYCTSSEHFKHFSPEFKRFFV